MSRKVTGIKQWTGPAQCPHCKGNLRKVGQDEISWTEAFTQAFSIFNSGWHKIAANMFQDQRGQRRMVSLLRQCENCNAYVTKCPSCQKLFVPGGKPGVFNLQHFDCPLCGCKVSAYNYRRFFDEEE